MATQQLLMSHIVDTPAGKLFFAQDLIGCGSRNAVDQALSRLIKNGLLVRVSRGVYARPSNHPFLGEMIASAQDIVKAFSELSGCKVQVSGASALNQLGLSTQVPTTIQFYTDGASRRFKRGKQTIVLQHVNPKVMVCAGTSGALVLSALYELGKANVDDAVINKIKDVLTPDSRVCLQKALPKMIGWMRTILTPLVTEL
jgi:hypothetical protein